MIPHYSDIAAFAETLDKGCEYNQVLQMMEDDMFIPFYEDSVKEIHVGYGKAYGFSDELSEIFDQFVIQTGQNVISG